MTNNNQITAGRAWLGMNQQDLANALGLSRPTCAALENNPANVSRGVLEDALDYFRRRGIEVSDAGIKVISEPLRVIKGEGWFLKLLDDVDWSGAPELLIEFSDDKISPPHVIDKYRHLRKNGAGGRGVKMRQLIQQGNEYLHGPTNEYRAIPQSHFKNWVTLIYGDNIAFSVDERQGCTIIRDRNVAEASRLKFELLWSLLPQPKKSVADVRF